MFLFIVACKEQVQKTNSNEEDKSSLSVVKSHNSFETVISNYKENTESWKSLKSLTVFLDRFKKASANEVLSNALELKVLSKALKDSVKPDNFKIASLDARINIMYNESLRLADMTNIPAIKADEVHKQTNKIIDAFSSINLKINTVLRKQDFEDAIDVDVSFIGLDSTKIDSSSKKSMKKRPLPNEELKRSSNNLKKRRQ